MPKVHDTRKQRARELLRMVQDGPSFDNLGQSSDPFTPARAADQYRLWSRSWIVEELIRLVPELRKMKREE